LCALFVVHCRGGHVLQMESMSGKHRKAFVYNVNCSVWMNTFYCSLLHAAYKCTWSDSIFSLIMAQSWYKSGVVNQAETKSLCQESKKRRMHTVA